MVIACPFERFRTLRPSPRAELIGRGTDEFCPAARSCPWMGASPPTTIVVDVSAFAPDAVTVDALARLQIAARRAGRRLQLRNASDDLQKLIAFVGLDGVLRVEPGRKAEERKDRLGVEEERELDDPPA
jgi:anti-anti-sigma regulatory factor